MHAAFSVRRIIFVRRDQKRRTRKKIRENGVDRGQKPINNKDIYAVFQNIRNVSELEEKP